MLPAFLVYTDDLKNFKGVISKEDFADAMWAIAEYTEAGEEPVGLSPMATVMFRTIKAKVDRESEKYERKCEAGAKGGRPRKENQGKPTETNENQGKPTKTSEKQNNQKEIETEKETETETIINDNVNAHARAETPFGRIDIDPVIVKVQKELNGLTDTHYDLLAQYRASLGDDLISFAIDQAVAQGVRKWAYVERILTTWQEKGIRTVGEAKAEDEKRKAAPKGRDAPKVVNAAKFPQRQYDGKQLEDEYRDDFLKYAGVQ